ncbi:hypothetical protein, partial [Paenibacillus alvei]
VQGMSKQPDFKKGESVKHISKKLSEASFYGWSKSGKRIGVKHNELAPYGVGFVIDWYAPENIVKAGEGIGDE